MIKTKRFIPRPPALRPSAAPLTSDMDTTSGMLPAKYEPISMTRTSSNRINVSSILCLLLSELRNAAPGALSFKKWRVIWKGARPLLKRKMDQPNSGFYIRQNKQQNTPETQPRAALKTRNPNKIAPNQQIKYETRKQVAETLFCAWFWCFSMLWKEMARNLFTKMCTKRERQRQQQC